MVQRNIEFQWLTVQQSLHIWGESNHVLAARNLLQSMLSQCDREMVYKREGLWRKAQPHWEDRERYEQTKRDQEILLKRLRREPEMTDSDLKVSSTPYCH